MANIAPCSTITLYSNIPITNGQQLAFKKVADQTAYFASKKISGHESTNCTYVRRTGQLKIQDKMGIMLQCNYFSFKNGNADFENKTIYCRVTDFSYINNNTVLISYVVDWFQTFMFDVTYESAILEREHLSVTDWSSAVSNPYRNDIYELLTEEGDFNITKSMEKVYNSGEYLVPYMTGQTGSDMSYDVAYTYASKYKTICMLISNFDRAEFADDPFVDFDVYIESDGTVVKPAGGSSILQGYFPNTSVKVPVPRAFTVGFIGWDAEADKLKVDKMKNIIDFLTVQGLTCQVIGVYLIDEPYVQAFADTIDGGVHSTYYAINKGTYGFTGIQNPKMYRAPFEYIRVETSNGDIKEYQYENFYSIASGATGAKAELHYLATIDGMPLTAIAPKDYLENLPTGATGIDNTIKLNLKERVEFGAYPQIGFTTDAYLTFLSNQYQQNLQSRTTASGPTTFFGKMGNVVSTFGNALSQSGVGTPLLNPIGVLAGAINTVNESVATTNQLNAYNEASTLRNLSGDDASQIASGEAISKVFDNAKKGFVADQYHAGSAGSLPYYLAQRDAGALKITRVQLKETYAKQIDKLLTKFGYSSNRVGLPRICNYMNNSGVSSKLPKFLLQENGQYETYVKCQQIDVHSTMKPVSDFIEAMFKNGMRFIDGSSLVS